MKKFKITSRDVLAFLGVALGTGIYCFGVIFIINHKFGDSSCFYASGVTGLSMLIMRCLEKITGLDLSYVLSIFISLLNVPLFIIGWKSVSKKFAVLTIASIALQTLFNILFTYLAESGFDPFEAFEDSKITMAILAGLIMGCAEGICLRVGGSSGGTDIISQAYSFKKKTPFTSVSFIINFVIVSLGGLLNGFESAAYTVVFLIMNITVLGKVFTIYKFMRVTIVTEEKGRLKEGLLQKFNHGITINQAVGAYSNKPKYVLETIVASNPSV